jgi:hypothetical protein
MIRLLGFLIRCVLSLVLVVLGLVFLGPFLVESVDQWMGKAEESQSAAEKLSVIERVRELLNEKEMNEVGLDDLLGLIESEDSSSVSSENEADTLQMKVEQLGLSPADIEALGGVYRDFWTEDRGQRAEARMP